VKRRSEYSAGQYGLGGRALAADERGEQPGRERETAESGHDGNGRYRKLDQEGADPQELLYERAASDRAEGHRQWG